VQAIVDSNKRILFRSINSRGAEHDSTALKNSNFYRWLEKNWKKLAEQKFYFIGDSAYAIKSFLMTPFDNAVHGTPEDNYNFFHSSSRIWVECAFGEIDLRWGILWKPLGFRLRHNVNIIDACMRLHNFIVDWRKVSNSCPLKWMRGLFFTKITGGSWPHIPTWMRWVCMEERNREEEWSGKAHEC
jgi:hypothetical protein